MIEALNGLKVRLETAGLHVFLGEAPRGQKPPYAVLIPDRDEDVQARLAGPYSTEQVAVTAASVGETPEQSLWVDAHVDAQLRPGGRGVTFKTNTHRIDDLRRRATATAPDDSATRCWRTASVYTFRQQPISK